MCDGTGVFFRTFIVELICTTIIVAYILAKKYKDNTADFNGDVLNVVLVLFGLIVSSATLSGACFNPALGIASQFF